MAKKYSNKIKYLAIWTTLLLGSTPCFAQDTLTPFTLLDQQDHPHAIAFPAHKPCILIIGDRDSANQAKEWGASLGLQLKDKVTYIAIAAMGGVPELFRGFAKGSINNPHPTLLDWDNKISTPLGLEPKQCLVILTNKTGTILTRQKGPLTPEKLQQLVVKFQKLIDPH